MDTKMKMCKSCHSNKNIEDFISAYSNRELKTCARCRDKSKNQVIPRGKAAQYSREFRKRNPQYDKRNRTEYMRKYRLIKANKTEPVM